MMKNAPFAISVNGQFDFEYMPADANALDMLTPDGNTFHVLKDGHSYHVELIEVDYAQRCFAFRIGGERFEANIADHYERLIRELGLSVGGVQKMNTVKAPMPGLVLGIMVQVGQHVQKGDNLLILEAMKMENVIKASGDAVVKSIKIAKGTAVDKGQLLIEME